MSRASGGAAPGAALRTALYGCFGALSNSLDFEGKKVTRVGAFDLLTRMDEPVRRKKKAPWASLPESLRASIAAVKEKKVA